MAKAALEVVAKAAKGSRGLARRIAGMPSLMEEGQKEEPEAEEAAAAMI